MRERWIELYSPKTKGQDDNRLYLSAFIGIYGDLPVDKVTRKMVRDVRDLLKERPCNMPHAVAKLPLKDQVAWGKLLARLAPPRLARYDRLRHAGHDPSSRKRHVLSAPKKIGDETPRTPPPIRWAMQEIRRIATRLAQRRIEPARVIA